MKKSVLLIVMVLVLSLAVNALNDEYVTPFRSTKTIGVERVTHYDPRVNYDRIDGWVYLYPSPTYQPLTQNYDPGKGVGRGGYPPIYPRATANIYSRIWYGFPTSSVTIKTKDLPPSDDVNAMYEAWMVDAETGYRLSLGTFTTHFGGAGALEYRSNTYLSGYDFIEITIEPFYDDDVSPGPVVIAAALAQNENLQVPPPSYFDPVPKQAKLVTEVFSTV